MKYSIVFGLSLLFQTIACAQSDATYYFGKDGHECSKELATTYRKVKLVDAKLLRYSFEDYFIEGQIKAQGFYLYKFPNKTGTHTQYYKNGNKKSKGAYLSDGDSLVGQKINTWLYWYENGSIQLQEVYDLDTVTSSFKSYIVSFWDTAGAKKVVDGNGECSLIEEYLMNGDSDEEIALAGHVKNGQLDGTWKGVLKDGTLYCEEKYSKGELIEGKSYGRYRESYTYNKVEVKPEFQGGDAALIRFLQENIVYPYLEKNENIQGRVMLRFIVNTQGKVQNPIVVSSVSSGLDNEALRVVSMLPDFKPGILRGQPVNVYYNLPIVFRLR